jgi:hypothetical protein
VRRWAIAETAASDRLLLTRQRDRPPTPAPTEGYVSVATLLKESTHEIIVPVRRPALAGHDPSPPPGALLALDLGQKTGWAVRTADGVITSGTVAFPPGRHEGGGMGYLRFRRWLDELRLTTGGLAEVLWRSARTAARLLARSLATSRLGVRRAPSPTPACRWERSSATSPARATPTKTR